MKKSRHLPGTALLILGLFIACAVYWSGLRGEFLFDDYPNIVDNRGVQPPDDSIASLAKAALSSPSSEFKRPLASLSFAINYLNTGLDPYWMKLTNLVIHLLNGVLVFLLTRRLLSASAEEIFFRRSSDGPEYREKPRPQVIDDLTYQESRVTGNEIIGESPEYLGRVAALVALTWMLLPINLTAVLYVVQRMESMANVFVLLGLTGYVIGRQKMLRLSTTTRLGLTNEMGTNVGNFSTFRQQGFTLCAFSIVVPTIVGVMAKETAVLLPLYALIVEWALFRFNLPYSQSDTSAHRLGSRHDSLIKRGMEHPGSWRALAHPGGRYDWRIGLLFFIVLVIPMTFGLAWLLPGILNQDHWATRDFTLKTRLLSETRIVVDYMAWTVFPSPHTLSFYHDDFRISTSLWNPWTTLPSIGILTLAIVIAIWLRPRWPLFSLGISLFLGCQLLTGTILPLELVYEHRNYFASFGLMLAIVPILAKPRSAPFWLPRYVLLGGLILCWVGLTSLTAYEWGNPLRLATSLAARAPLSPRAQYELGRTYIIYSKYDPDSPFTKLAYGPLETAAALPHSSILPEQALIFMNSRMHLPLRESWWNSMIHKLTMNPPGVQDESSLDALTQCEKEHHCDLPVKQMSSAYLAALAHAQPSARLLAMYGDYSWSVLGNHDMGMRMTNAAVAADPNEPAYHITQIRMLLALGRAREASSAMKNLQNLNIGGRLDDNIRDLNRQIIALNSSTAAPP